MDCSSLFVEVTVMGTCLDVNMYTCLRYLYAHIPLLDDNSA